MPTQSTGSRSLCVLFGFLPLASCAAADESSECATWAAAGECAANPGFMKSSCRLACQCEQWAAAGECTANPEYMKGHCAQACTLRTISPPPPPAFSDDQCALWAASGECEGNAPFMIASCAAACASIAVRHNCSVAVCAGLPEPVCGGKAPTWIEGNRTWYPQHPFGTVVVPIAFVNEGPTPARLVWVDDAQQKEMSFGVVMPGARSVQMSYLGHHWLARELMAEREPHANGRLLLDVRARVSPLRMHTHAIHWVRPCARPHSRRMIPHWPSS